MFNRKEKLSMLEVERAKQIEKIRKIESNIKELWDKEQSIRSQQSKKAITNRVSRRNVTKCSCSAINYFRQNK